MMVIPAIDLKDGKCVRLSQGRMDRETIYSEDPLQMAKHWEAKGAERLHVIDLNGAVTGKPIHQALIKHMMESVHIPIEIGGGIRDLDTIKEYCSSGARWVVLGTVALKNPQLLEGATGSFPGQIILAIDAKRGQVAIQGWNEILSSEVKDLVSQFAGVDLSAVIFTDIERDGMGTGLNWESTRALAQVSPWPVIASGGCSRLEEIERLKELEAEGVIGVIVGRALYTGQIDLESAIRIGKGRILKC
jgi:phosphoribosylformimino-5-aminoimidazole carboxamide ribotide isomerase